MMADGSEDRTRPRGLNADARRRMCRTHSKDWRRSDAADLKMAPSGRMERRF